MNKKGFAISSIIYAILILFLALVAGILGLLGNRKLILDKLKNDVMLKLNNEKIGQGLYKDNSGANIPELYGGMVPVMYQDGNWVYADVYSKWYDYDLKEWANAVILENGKTHNVGDIIPESDIAAYFVWIPRYKYQIFDIGNYSSPINVNSKPSNINKEINIVFESKLTPQSTGNTVGSFLTHPAFTSLDVNGIWVAKFEVSGSAGNIKVKPGVPSWRSATVGTFWNALYNYNRTLDSHMMKNTEWGAVAYLSHSKYGIGTEVNINNNQNYLTGYSATSNANQSLYPGVYGTDASLTQPYDSETGYLASTTGNITGIYDMSGGAYEFVAAYRKGQDPSKSGLNTELSTYSKYFDAYDETINSYDYSKRILGDATGEMGPFYSYYDNDNTRTRVHNAWYSDLSYIPISSAPWFKRGGGFETGVLGGIFYFEFNSGEGVDISTRLVLDVK